ncbi:MAG: hypothetical protein DWI03_03935 [Planctomycetota bacterium]|nr:MAG: hypothetical protein DWI03_03935 [Planctomycetota bacterium]
MSGTAARTTRSLPGLAAVLVRAWWPQVAALAAACGVVAATLVGALGVGSAMQRGLRSLALDRLGRIDAAVLADGFFRRQLVDEIDAPTNAASVHAGPAERLVPALVLEATADAGGRTSRITLLACDDPAALGFTPPPPPLEADSALVNGPLAAALGLADGAAFVLRLPRRSSVPADSPLGRRTAESNGRRLRVTAVLPEHGVARFSLRPTVVTAPLAVVPLAAARDLLQQGDVINAAFAVGGGDDAPASADRAARLHARLRPQLADLGLALTPAADDAASVRLTSRRLIIPPEVDDAADRILTPLGGRPSLAFLATVIRPVEADGSAARAAIPYSTVLGIDGTSHPAGDLVDDTGKLLPTPTDDEIIVDRWMADDLQAQGHPLAVGDRISIGYFLPETVGGSVAEGAATLRISGIAAMRGAAVARELVPDVEGITDEASIADWDPPFPFDQSRVRTTPPHDEDDRYWKDHGTTPKAFVSLATARRLAGSRFGGTTAWHVPRQRVPAIDDAARALAEAIPAQAAGLRAVPLRADALRASRGATPFGGLFLALSSFVVTAGLVLEWLLFSLLVAARRRDVGTLAAIGWPPRRLTLLLLAVAGLAASAGVGAGAIAGPAWTGFLLGMLGKSWNADVDGGSAAVFTALPAAVDIWPGALAALVVSLAAVARAASRAGYLPPLALLRRGDDRDAAMPSMRRGFAPLLAALALGAALVAAAAGRWSTPQAALGLFFTAGLSALVGTLALVRLWLRGPRTQTPPVASLPALAGRNLGQRPARAFSVAAIVAAAQFLVVAVSSFAQRPPTRPEDRASPTGGWTTIATFGTPTSVDPSDPAMRDSLGVSSAGLTALDGCTVARLRTNGGDDASCTNLYAAAQPTVLGVGPDFIARGGFRFVAHAGDAAAAGNPWTLLDAPTRSAIPAILDQATAQWALKLGGVGARFSLLDEAGRPVDLEIVALLEPGILQGSVIVAERNFQRLFPGRSGYGMALVDAAHVAGAARAEVPAALAAAWADAGVKLVPAVERLRSLQAVQNTFLSAFQALGTLGLLLGTAGVAAVQVQGTVERLDAFALLRAIGFTLGRIRLLLVLETLLPVAAGLAAGTLAGSLAVTPALVGGTARVPLGWIAATCGLTLAVASLAAVLAASRTAIPQRPSAA